MITKFKITPILIGIIWCHILILQSIGAEPKSKADLWLVGMDNKVYKVVEKKVIKVTPEGVGKAISVAPDGTPWIIGMDDKLYRLKGKKWEKVNPEGAAKAISFLRDGTPIIIGMDNKVYKLAKDKWVPVEPGIHAKAIASP